MGRVADLLVERLIKHLRARRIVVWYDGEGVYGEFVSNLNIEGVRILRYRGSFFRLRHEIEPFLEGLEQWQVLVYVDRQRSDTDHALIEADLTGMVWEPGALSRPNNTRLGVVTREALQGQLAEVILEKVCDEANAGKRTLAEVDRIDQPSAGVSAGVLALVYETSTPAEIALRFLTDDALDDIVEARGAQSELQELLRVVYGFPTDPKVTPAVLRRLLARHAILSELAAIIPEVLDRGFQGVPVARRRAEIEAVRELLEAWRDSEGRRPQFVAAAGEAEVAFPISNLGIQPEQILGCDAFAGVDRLILDAAEAEVAGGRFEAPLRWHEARRGRFWARFNAEIAHRWAAIEAAGRVMSEAFRIAGALTRNRYSLEDLVVAYAQGLKGEDPWCRLDRYHRILCRIAVEPGLSKGFELAFATARRRFDEVSTVLADMTIQATAIPGGAAGKSDIRQTNIFVREIAPRMESGRVAYLWVDALRYEMAEDLASGLPGETTLRPALAVVPTVTPLGMAALLPYAETGFEVVKNGADIAVRIADKVLQNRQDRIAYLKKAVEGVVDMKLEDLIAGRRGAKEKASKASLLLVTSQEIDQFAEADNEPIARRIMDAVLGDLRRAIRTLAEWGFAEVIVTSDHGFLFGDRVGDDLLIQPPGGETLDLHRRVWIGRGGSNPAGTIRLPLSAFGLSGSFDVVLPSSLSVFRAGGSRTYFHGGATLSERVVPVLAVRLAPPAADRPGQEIVVIEIDRERGIRNRIFTIALTYESLVRPRRRITVAGQAGDEIVAEAATAEYGYFAGTREVEMEVRRRNVVTLALSRDADRLTIAVRDAETGRILEKIADVSVRLGI